MKKIQQMMMVLVLGLMASCAHISAPLDTETAKQVAPDEGKALVIAYWDQLVPFGAAPLYLLDGKKPVNLIERGRKVYYQADPGKRVLAVGTDNLIPFGGYDFVFFDANLEAGKVYYIAMNAYRGTGMIDSLTGVHIKVHNPTFQDGEQAAAQMTVWLNSGELAAITPEGHKLFEGAKPDVLERYVEQLDEWKIMPAEQRIVLRASEASTLAAKLHGGKWL